MAPCTGACPIQVDARGYIDLISKGKFDEALVLVRQKNPFPAITGRLCAVRAKGLSKRDVDQPHRDDLLKRFLADRENLLLSPFHEEAAEGFCTPGPEKGAGVAIVGSGPTV